MQLVWAPLLGPTKPNAFRCALEWTPLVTLHIVEVCFMINFSFSFVKEMIWGYVSQL